MKIHIEGATEEQVADLKRFATVLLDPKTEVTAGAIKGKPNTAHYLKDPLSDFYVGQVVKGSSDSGRRFVITSLTDDKDRNLNVVEFFSNGSSPNYFPHCTCQEFRPLDNKLFIKDPNWK